MVKLFIALLFVCSSLLADSTSLDSTLNSILGTKGYNANKGLIDVVFKQKSNYYNGNSVDVIKVMQALENNKLVNLSLKTSQDITLNFSTKASPIFLVKILSDALRNIGYYKYMTKESHIIGSEFSWSIEYNGDSVIDPVALETELAKSGCHLTDIQTANPASWSYEIEMNKAHLSVPKLDLTTNITSQRDMSEMWIDVSGVSKVSIDSNRANSWYPSIAFYDQGLHLLKVQKIDSKTSSLSIDLLLNTVYMKISDLYSLNNIKNGFNIEAQASR
ncbi:MAG: hypothetical protein PHX13_08565 [Thiovulaceae bacterium]|nr:hypothetical protein [Sulfurimonadaceae bacterium]